MFESHWRLKYENKSVDRNSSVSYLVSWQLYVNLSQFANTYPQSNIYRLQHSHYTSAKPLDLWARLGNVKGMSVNSHCPVLRNVEEDQIWLNTKTGMQPIKH